jgi:hypothetical protein
MELTHSLIRTQLKNGLLRLGTVAQSWAGPSIGKSCDACASLIERADTEFEVEVVPPTAGHYGFTSAAASP